jgi:hypothetical protein
MNYQSNTLGYDEVVDTLADSITVYRKISTPLQDSFQFPDLLSLYDAYPHLREMYDDRKRPTNYKSKPLDLAHRPGNNSSSRFTL